MSLVSDALRKARREASLRAAPRLGYVLPPRLVTPPAIRRAPRGLAFVVAIAVAAALLGAAAAWWLLADRGGRRAAQGASAEEVAPAGGRRDAAAQGEAAGRGDTAGSVPALSPADQAPTPAAAAAAAPPSGATEPATIAAAPSPPPTPTAARPGGEGAPAERSFRIDADLGYATLHLDYLVYKPSAPFGRVNGQDVVIGSVVDGFVVEEITADAIRLRDKRGVVVLRVH